MKDLLQRDDFEMIFLNIMAKCKQCLTGSTLNELAAVILSPTFFPKTRPDNKNGKNVSYLDFAPMCAAAQALLKQACTKPVLFSRYALHFNLGECKWFLREGGEKLALKKF